MDKHEQQSVMKFFFLLRKRYKAKYDSIEQSLTSPSWALSAE
jgi:hypothetical protein